MVHKLPKRFSFQRVFLAAFAGMSVALALNDILFGARKEPQPSKQFCDQATTCVFDVGFNVGQDTRFYLKHPGISVVAIEANPVLSARATKQDPFKSALRSNRLKLISKGIAKDMEAGNITFWVNDNDLYSSFVEAIGCRKIGRERGVEGDHTYCKPVPVPTTNCAELVGIYGTPEYMKIDIEGLNHACVEQLLQISFAQRPKFISVEGVTIRDINLFQKLGYNYFKIVNQKTLQTNIDDALEGYSGPWGEDAHDFFVGKRWQTRDEALQRIPLRVKTGNGGGYDWFDLHARKAPSL